jgi:hypothetical protein
MTDLAKAIAMSGALNEGMLRELTKWRLPGVVVPDGQAFGTPEEAVEAIEEALTSAGQVEMRVTDLDVLKDFLVSRKEGKLYLVGEQGARGTWPVTFGVIDRRSHLDYIIPWNSDTIEMLLTNGESCLIDDKKKKIYFGSVTDLYFGEQKAFILCTPIREGHGKRSTSEQK